MTGVAEDRRSEAEVERNLEDAQPAKGDPDAGGTSRRNLPKFSTRDWLGIVVGVAGTIALFLIAGDCEDRNIKGEEQGDGLVQVAGGCAIRFLLAVGAFLVNLAHITGILIFESIGYQGRAEKVIAGLTLFGTPAAIVIALLVGPA